MSRFSILLRTATFAAACALVGLTVAEPAAAQFGGRVHQGGGSLQAGGRASVNAGPRNFGRNGSFNAGSGSFRGAATFNGGGRHDAARGFTRGGNVVTGGRVNRGSGGARYYGGIGSFGRGHVAPQSTWSYRGLRPRNRYSHLYGYVAPYPDYTPFYVGGVYRTCVIRKRWVHTRFGWRRLPRRICFRRYD